MHQGCSPRITMSIGPWHDGRGRVELRSQHEKGGTALITNPSRVDCRQVGSLEDAPVAQIAAGEEESAEGEAIAWSRATPTTCDGGRPSLIAPSERHVGLKRLGAPCNF